MGNKAFETFLLYRGSRDGWRSKDFHSKCDEKGATISLFKIKDGSCFGGFTSASWSTQGQYDIYKKDETAMLFNLTWKRIFPFKGASWEWNNNEDNCAIYCHIHSGPSFGMWDFISIEPFNDENNITSSPLYNTYQIPIDHRGGRFRNMLTDVEYKEFHDPFRCTIVELEVWKVKFIE